MLDYFQKNKIRSISLKNGELVMSYQNSTTETQAITTPELQLIKSYCQAKGISFLTLGDLERNNTQQPRNNKPLLYIAAAGLFAVVIGLVAYLVYQSRKNSRRR